MLACKLYVVATPNGDKLLHSTLPLNLTASDAVLVDNVAHASYLTRNALSSLSARLLERDEAGRVRGTDAGLACTHNTQLWD